MSVSSRKGDHMQNNYKDCICGECKYLCMHYDRHDWEVYSCCNEDGRGTDDIYEEACKHFEEREDK